MVDARLVGDLAGPRKTDPLPGYAESSYGVTMSNGRATRKNEPCAQPSFIIRRMRVRINKGHREPSPRGYRRGNNENTRTLWIRSDDTFCPRFFNREKFFLELERDGDEKEFERYTRKFKRTVGGEI